MSQISIGTTAWQIWQILTKLWNLSSNFVPLISFYDIFGIGWSRVSLLLKNKEFPLFLPLSKKCKCIKHNSTYETQNQGNIIIANTSSKLESKQMRNINEHPVRISTLLCECIRLISHSDITSFAELVFYLCCLLPRFRHSFQIASFTRPRRLLENFVWGHKTNCLWSPETSTVLFVHYWVLWYIEIPS